LTDVLICFKKLSNFFGFPENDRFREEREIESAQLGGAVAPLSSKDGIKPIARRF
jgi:hypothetical protein